MLVAIAAYDVVLTANIRGNRMYTMQAMYVQRNIQARSRNHSCRGKAMSITYLYVCTRARACVCVVVGARA